MRRFGLYPLSVAAFLSCGAMMTAGGSEPTDAFDVLHYDLHISFNFPAKSFAGSVGVTAASLRPLREMKLDAADASIIIDSVYAEDLKIEFTHAVNTLTIAFDEAIPESTKFEVSIFYHGRSEYTGEYDEGGVYFISNQRLATISEPGFARTWWPCKDRPSDKATAHITITVPESLTAVSNGVLKDVTRRAGTATYAWETNYPTATYLFSVAAAPYARYSETYTGSSGVRMPVDYYVYPEDSAASRIDFQNTVRILGIFAGIFGEYPFIREKFGLAEVDGSMTMEHQTICSIQKSLLTGDRKYETTIVHETAHHWWGNFITPLNWKHTWLSEGFATYAEALYIEKTEGKDSAAGYIREWMGNEQGMYAGSVTGRSDTSFWDSFAPRVYNKGALVLHMLRGVTGDSLFFTILRNYLSNPVRAFGNAVTEDFIRECEHVTGTPMKWFFDQWVFNAPESIDRPEYRYRWESTGSENGFTTTLHLEQPTADKQFYRMPVTISLVYDGSREDTTVENTLPSQSFTFVSKSRPTDLLIDPGDKIMKIVKKEKPRQSK